MENRTTFGLVREILGFTEFLDILNASYFLGFKPTVYGFGYGSRSFFLSTATASATAQKITYGRPLTVTLTFETFIRKQGF